MNEDRMKIQIKPEKMGETIAEALIRQGIHLPLPCGGTGICGKCRVRVLEGMVLMSKEEEKYFSKKQQMQGYHLACCAVLQGECEIECLFQEEEQIQVERENFVIETPLKGTKRASSCIAAVDLGTTTIAMALFSFDGEQLAFWSGINHQRDFGADVISRLQAARSGRAKELKNCVREDIRRGLLELLKRAGRAKRELLEVILAGNTAMIHLFFEYPVEELAKYPFTPYSLEPEVLPLRELDLEFLEGALLTTMPCLSAYIGGDITAGLITLLKEQPDRNGTIFFLDLGTNAEMICRHEGNYYMASAAAGPVFEGGNMSCGVAGIPGAISEFYLEDSNLQYKTIKEEKAEGICGSGYISAFSVLKKLDILKVDGSLRKNYQEYGYVFGKASDGSLIQITQADVREYQLAKAAVRAGIKLLVEACETKETKIEWFGVAGGFGAHLDLNSAMETGLLPRLPKKRYQILKNTSLRGCIYYGLTKIEERNEIKEKLIEIKNRQKQLNLAELPRFQETFISCMNF